MPHAIKMHLIAEEKPIQVMLELDMSSYCIALREYVAVKRQIENERQTLDLVSTKAILKQEHTPRLESYEQAMSEIYDRVQKEKNVLSALVRGIAGEMHGVTLIELLKSRLAVGDEAEKILAARLELSDKPLVFECLESDFVELLKNSMDAIIDTGVESGLRQDMHLKMHLHLELLPDSLVTISIRDNGSGFSVDYLEQFSAYIKEKKYLNNVYITQKNNSSFYFGGRGRGIGGICGKLLDGVGINSNHTVRIYHPDSCRNSMISIKNVGRGAELTMKSSTAPTKKHVGYLGFFQDSVIEQVTPLFRGESLVLHGTPSTASASSESTPSCKQPQFFSRPSILPLNPADLIEVDATLS